MPAEFRGISAPVPPATTSRRTVTTAAELAAALGVSGTQIDVAPGRHVLEMVSRATDQIINCAPGATIAPTGSTALTLSAARRIEVRGCRLEGGVYVLGASDIKFYDVTLVSKDTGSIADSVEFGGSTRVLIEHSTFTTPRYVAYSSDCVDFIVANSQMHSVAGLSARQSSIRFVNTRRGVVLDSRITNPTHHNLRAHAGSSLIYWSGNQLEGGGLYAADNPVGALNVSGIWATDNRIYHTATNLFSFYSPPEVLGAILIGNRGYSGNGGAASMDPGGTDPTWIVRENVREPYRAPPVWSML
jgi:hypothetical protein